MDFIKLLLIAVYRTWIIRTSNLVSRVAASHVAPKIWFCLKGGVVRMKLCLMRERHKIRRRACKLVRIDLKYVNDQTNFIAKVFPHYTWCFRPENDFGCCWLMDLLFYLHFLNWYQFPEYTLLPGVWHELIFAPRTSFCLSKTNRVYYCAFHKHANSKVQKPPSQLRFSLPPIIMTITSNEPWNKGTHKTDRNPPITDHKSWAFEPVKVNFCFLRGPPRWLTAAKIENVSWLLMRSPLSQEVTWPAATRVLSRGKRRNPRSEIVE